MQRATADPMHAVSAAQHDQGPGSLNEGWTSKAGEIEGVKGALLSPVRQLLVGKVGVRELGRIRGPVPPALSSAQFATAEAGAAAEAAAVIPKIP